MSDFKIIPAVDLLDGRIVRLLHGDYDRVTVYGDEAGAQALQFVDAGAELIHIVDLNAARTGERGVNASAIESIASACAGRAEIELGGGVRNLESVTHYLELGVARVIVGTAAVRDPQFVRAALAEHGPRRIIVGVDARDDRVKVAGWEEDGGLTTSDFLQRLEGDGVAEVILTDIAVDGALTGPSIPMLRRALSDTTAMRLIASGGVARIEDIDALLDLGEPRLVGAISGRAIYEGTMDLAAAVARTRR